MKERHLHLVTNDFEEFDYWDCDELIEPDWIYNPTCREAHPSIVVRLVKK